MRRELGHQLATRRKEAGYIQRELGDLLGYSRTAVGNAETGIARLGREIWQRADRVLGTGELFTRGYERIQAQLAAEVRAHPLPAVSGAGAHEPAQVSGLESPAASRARQACHERGWPAEEDREGRLWLVTGTVIDALEVPRQAGMLAVGWWLYTRGVPDEIRGLPALPDPAGALAVFTAGSRCYFLTRSGVCPWTRQDIDTADGDRRPGPAVVRWHADGGRVPGPPSHLKDGGQAVWAHVPAADGPLVSPMALLHVLAHTVAATAASTSLILPGGVRAVPAAGR